MRGVVATVVALSAAALCVRLGFWQLDRLHERQARNEAVRAAQLRPPVPLDSAAFAVAASDAAAWEWRPVEASGSYRHEGDMVLRARARDGRPGVHLVSPLVLPDGRVVMVNRGWVPAPDGATADVRALRTAAPVRVRGVLRAMQAGADAGMPASGRAGRDTTWRRVDLAVARVRAGGPVLPLVLQQLPSSADPADPPLPEPLPELSEGNHLSYAVQWFSFAVIALVGLVVLLRRNPH
jgi:surfeit locus 1 family protein